MTLDDANDLAEKLGRKYGKSEWGCVEEHPGLLYAVGPVFAKVVTHVYGTGNSPHEALNHATKVLDMCCDPVTEAA